MNITSSRPKKILIKVLITLIFYLLLFLFLFAKVQLFFDICKFLYFLSYLQPDYLGVFIKRILKKRSVFKRHKTSIIISL
jgi:hypothetical protein